MPAPFIVFEGGEGCGKTTQIDILVKKFQVLGLPFDVTREPGGTPAAETLRKLVTTGAPNEWDALGEVLLFNAARRNHIMHRIMPALQNGILVLSDRYVASTLTYQGWAGGVSIDLLKKMHSIFCFDLCPDLTLILDCPATVGLQRAKARALQQGNEISRFEDKNLAFHEKLREGYLQMQDLTTDSHVIDATQPIDAVAEMIYSYVQPVLDMWVQSN